MLKKGCAWHYVAYDQRPELAAVSDLNYIILSDDSNEHTNNALLSLLSSMFMTIFWCSGRGRLVLLGWDYGLLPTQKCHGNGERTSETGHKIITAIAALPETLTKVAISIGLV